MQLSLLSKLVPSTRVVAEVSVGIIPISCTTGDFIVDGTGSGEKPSCQ